jgi:hypothetical protein
MDHRRHDEAVLQRQSANGERLEKPGLHRLADIQSVTHWSISPVRCGKHDAKAAIDQPRVTRRNTITGLLHFSNCFGVLGGPQSQGYNPPVQEYPGNNLGELRE